MVSPTTSMGGESVAAKLVLLDIIATSQVGAALSDEYNWVGRLCRCWVTIHDGSIHDGRWHPAAQCDASVPCSALTASAPG
jgi:hypothetical protein